jgi:hypothetical protein
VRAAQSRHSIGAEHRLEACATLLAVPDRHRLNPEGEAPGRRARLRPSRGWRVAGGCGRSKLCHYLRAWNDGKLDLVVVARIPGLHDLSGQFFTVAPHIALETDFLDRIRDNLELAHTKEKELFFRLLKEEFLQTLRPQYQNAT